MAPRQSIRRDKPSSSADVNKAPLEVGRKKRKRFEQVVVAFFYDRPTN
jgi:hypothetical protein